MPHGRWLSLPIQPLGTLGDPADCFEEHTLTLNPIGSPHPCRSEAFAATEPFGAGGKSTEASGEAAAK